jgi:antitoxin VapB
MVAKSTVFKTNRSQAVRLPKEVAFPDHVKEVEIIVEGNRRIIVPAGSSWADWFEHGPRWVGEFPELEDLPPDDRLSFDD